MLLRRRMMGGGGEVPYEEQYLTFEALEAGTFNFKIGASLATTVVEEVSYSVDEGSTWTKTSNINGQEINITTPEIPAGSRVLWRGVANSFGNNSSDAYSCRVSSSGSFNLYGNIFSLFYDSSFVGKTDYPNATSYRLYMLFRYCNVIDASNLILIGSLTNYCYRYMFAGSTLEKAPTLPVKTLVSNCYRDIFNGCSNLMYIKMLATDISATNCLGNWVSNVAASGTFVKKVGVTIPSGASGIPNSWTVIEEP